MQSINEIKTKRESKKFFLYFYSTEFRVADYSLVRFHVFTPLRVWYEKRSAEILEDKHNWKTKVGGGFKLIQTRSAITTTFF